MEARRNLLPRLLAGLEVGILGGLAILGWFLVLSYWNFRAPWALVNLFSASFRRNAAWGFNFSSLTWSGLAVHLFACGLLGIFIGWVLPRPHHGARISLTGLAFGVILSLMVYEFFWRRLIPIGDYFAPAAMLIVHLLFGMSLAQFPRYYLRLGPPAYRSLPVLLPLPEGKEPLSPPEATPPSGPAERP